MSSGSTLHVSVAAATAKAGGANKKALKGVAMQTTLRAASNPRQHPGLYMLYTPWGALPVGHEGFQEVHWVEEEPDGFNAYGQVIYRINWPKTARYLLRIWWRMGSPEDVLFYGVRQDGKQIELSIDDMERLADMDASSARKDIRARNNPRRKVRVYHIAPRNNVVFLVDRVNEIGRSLVADGLAERVYAEESEERVGPRGKQTIKMVVEGMPSGRVPPWQSEPGEITPWYDRDMPADYWIRERIKGNIGVVIGSYTEG